MSWEEVRLGDVCEFKYGKNLPEQSRINGKYPVYGSSSIIDTHEEFLVEGPGIIVGRKGTVGKVQYSKDDFFPIDTVFYIEHNLLKVNLKYLFYRLSYCGLENMNSDAAVPGLNRNLAMKQKVNLPSLKIQQKIVNLISNYDKLIENNNKRIKLLEEMAEEIYKEWFVRLRFPNYQTTKIVDGIPYGWEEKKISEILELNYGKALKMEDREGGEIPVFGSSGIVGWHNESFISESKIIVGRKGNVGSVYWSSEIFYPIDTAYYVTSNFSSYFLFFMLKRLPFVNSDAAVPGLNRNSAYSLKVIFPNENLIKKFESLIHSIFQEIDVLEQKNQNLKQTRNLLLPRLISGKLNIEDLDIK